MNGVVARLIKHGRAARATAVPIVAAGISVVLGIGVLWAMGYPVGEVVGTVWGKVIWADEWGRRVNRWTDVLERATPILLTGVAVMVAFRASVLNIGAEGQYLLGAIAAVAVGVVVERSGAVVGVLLTAMGAGAGLAAVAAILEWWRRVPVVLSTLLLNFVALEFLRYLVQGPMKAAGQQPQTRLIHDAAELPLIGGTRLHWGFVLAVVAVAIVAVVLRRTTFGFRLRVVGENATAARFAGIHVPRTALLTLALSGALAGLAGGVQVAGVRHQLALGDAGAGFGFTGIAVALLGRLTPAGVVAAALFFGVLGSAFRVLEGEMGIPFVTGQAVQGMIVIAMLVGTHMGRRKL